MATKKHNKYAIIVLAAGASRRLGRPKQLVRIGDETLLSKTIKNSTRIDNSDTYVILGAYSREITDTLHADINILTNPNWKNGMGNSISFGIKKILPYDYNAVILTVCDQPFLTDTHFKQLIESYENDKRFNIIISKYTTGKGPPSLFDSYYFDQLSTLDGDVGAKSIISENDSNVGCIDFYKGHIDIDEDKDLVHF